MGLFGKRKTRATRRAEARAIKAKAKLEAKLSAKNELRRFKAAQRAETKALRENLKAQREGALLSPTRIRRLLTVSRLLAPIVVPLVSRVAMAAGGLIDQRRADQLGVPLAQIGQYSGHGGQLSARIAGAEQSLRSVQDNKPQDAETRQFVTAISERLPDLAAALTAAQNKPPTRPRGAPAAISRQLDVIDADPMARLGLT